MRPNRVLPALRTPSELLFVCFGNIMRSPMCEALANRATANNPALVSRIRVTSAGLHATPGTPAHPWAIASAHALGVPLDHHRACLLTPEMVTKADVIFMMDYQNLAQFLSRHPQAHGRTFLLGAFGDSNQPSLEIPDPYYLGQDGTDRCYARLDTCVQNVLKEWLPM